MNLLDVYLGSSFNQQTPGTPQSSSNGVQGKFFSYQLYPQNSGEIRYFGQHSVHAHVSYKKDDKKVFDELQESSKSSHGFKPNREVKDEKKVLAELQESPKSSHGFRPKCAGDQKGSSSKKDLPQNEAEPSFDNVENYYPGVVDLTNRGVPDAPPSESISDAPPILDAPPSKGLFLQIPVSEIALMQKDLKKFVQIIKNGFVERLDHSTMQKPSS